MENGTGWKNRKKRRAAAFLDFLLCALLLFAFPQTGYGGGKKITKEISLSLASVHGGWARLVWESCPADSYRLYRLVWTDTGDGGETLTRVLEQTLPGSAHGCVIGPGKENESYSYLLEGRKKQKEREILYQGEISFCLGISRLSFDETLFCDAKTSPRSIPLRFFFEEEGIRPDGIIVYRREGKKPFKELAVLSGSADQFTDRSVESLKRYSYKLRAFARGPSGRRYGPISETVSFYAARRDGLYKAKTIRRGEDALLLRLKSRPGNGRLTLLEDGRYERAILSLGGEAFRLTRVSKDGRTFRPFGKRRLSLKAGESLWLEFKREDGAEGGNSCLLSAVYNGFTSTLILEPEKNRARSLIDLEYYH